MARKALRRNPIRTFDMIPELDRAVDIKIAGAQIRAEVSGSAEIIIVPALASDLDKGSMMAIVISAAGTARHYFELGSEFHRYLIAAGIGPVGDKKMVWGSLTLPQATRLAEMTS